MARTRVTIGEVAAKAGVSVSTVSKVINDRYGIAEDTSARVRAVIEELGYHASLVGQSLRSRRTNVLGVLVTDIEPFSAELLKGIARAVHNTDYELIVFSGSGRWRDQAGWESRYLSRISGTLADGAILVTPGSIDEVFGSPVVAVDHNVHSSSLPTVDSDNLNGAVSATEYLIGLGHRRIAFLAGRADLESARLRERGYRQALVDAKIEVDEQLIRVGGYMAETATAPARELLELDPRPTAIFAANDTTALETMAVARSLGLAVPRDVSVMGFDNVPESALGKPAADHGRAADPADGQRGRAAADRPHRRPSAASGPGGAADAARHPPVLPRDRGGHVTTVGEDTPPYRDADRPVGERVADLLGRMTAEEKVAQLGSAWVFQLVDGAGFSREQTQGLAAHGLGHVTRVSGASSLEAGAAAALSNEIQGYLVDGTRLGIPAIVHEEICSGLMARGSTVYPQAIGVASTWEPGLARALADAVRAQMRAMGAHQGLSPVLDICRDPRWGRTEETFGEDPYLVARMGVAFVRGSAG